MQAGEAVDHLGGGGLTQGRQDGRPILGVGAARIVGGSARPVDTGIVLLGDAEQRGCLLDHPLARGENLAEIKDDGADHGFSVSGPRSLDRSGIPGSRVSVGGAERPVGP